MIEKSLTILWFLLKSRELLFCVILFSLCVKISFLHFLVPYGFRTPRIPTPWFFLVGIILGSMMGDLAWSFKIGRELFAPHLPYQVVVFFIRLAWAFLIIQYGALAFFLQSLVHTRFKPSLFQWALICISVIFIAYFFYLAFFQFNVFATTAERTAARIAATKPFEHQTMRFVILYLINLLLAPGLYHTLTTMRRVNLPKILRKQIKIFIKFLLFPYLLAEIIQAGFSHFFIMQLNLTPILNISTLLLIYAIYYCMQQIMGLRFLNMNEHVEPPHSVPLFEKFKNTAQQLFHADNKQEMKHITEQFFKETFDIPLAHVKLDIFSEDSSTLARHPHHHLIEEFSKTTPGILTRTIPFLSYDEVAFTNFYEPIQNRSELLTFLDTIDAALFIPIYGPNTVIGSIIIEKNARPKECYHKSEYDQMVIFSQFLGNTIHLVTQRNVESLSAKYKTTLTNQYVLQKTLESCRESIRTLALAKQHKNNLIFFYKNRRFIAANLEAQQWTEIDLNEHVGHPLAVACRKIAHHVESSHTPTMAVVSEGLFQSRSIQGSLSSDGNTIILSISTPDSTDIINRYSSFLKDPGAWEYGLYLETTEKGKFLNQAIPGLQESLLDFKVKILRASLTNAPVWLNVHEEDLADIAELIHHVSNQETFFPLTLSVPEMKHEYAHLLFGKQTTFKPLEIPLLERLQQEGTLWIHNVHYLSRETQHLLSEFLTYGHYRPLFGTTQLTSAVRIICSSTKDLHQLVMNDMFDENLFMQLRPAHIHFPPLTALPADELLFLAQEFLHQALKTETFNRLLALSERDKEKIIRRAPLSFTALRQLVQQLLVLKSRRHELELEKEFDPAYALTDPELMHAARLGKHALKDPHLMHLLWEKFKNQNKIATFLGVNRSSVYRRCKEYELF